MKYDLLKEVKKIKVPVLLIVGEKDEDTSPEQQRVFYNYLNTKKEFYIIKNAPHTFREKTHLKETKDIFSKWLDSLRRIEDLD